MSSSVAPLPRVAKKVLISVNPHAGARSGRRAVERLAELLDGGGYAVQLVTAPDRLSRKAAAALEERSLRAVVAAGGDGTVAAAANLVEPDGPIAILPLGTENLLSKYIGLAADPESVFDAIDDGLTVRLDVGRAAGRVFLLMLSCGLDAEIVRRLHVERRGHIHHLSYAKPILDAIRSYQYPELRVYCDPGSGAEFRDAPEEIAARWAFVVNLPQYALGLNTAPEAVGTDGLLDVCTFRKGSLWHGLRYLGGVVLGRHRSWKDCVTTRVRRVRIESDGQVPYQLDGDPGGFLPVEIEIVPRRLRLIVPKKWASQYETGDGRQNAQ